MTNNPLLLEAIALKKCVTAVYNNVQMKLAPHILYSKHSALFMDAVILEKHGEARRDKKLGAFHLAGLNDLERPTSRLKLMPCSNLPLKNIRDRPYSWSTRPQDKPSPHALGLA